MRQGGKDQKVILTWSVKSMSDPTLRAFVSLFQFSELSQKSQSGWMPSHRDISDNFAIVSTKFTFSPTAVKDCAHQHIP